MAAMWVFGYGSLVWKTGFPFQESIAGYVKGFSRRFWQSSPDHRGTPEQPGRTVTLVSDPAVPTPPTLSSAQREWFQGEVWGVAYRISQENEEKVTAYLDHREKAGYESCEVEFHPDDSTRGPFRLNVYISPPSPDNPHWVGSHETEDVIAEHVVKCVGPSGSNIEYLVRLAEAQRALNPGLPDPHLFTIERLVLDKCRQRGIHDPVLAEFRLLSPP